MRPLNRREMLKTAFAAAIVSAAGGALATAQASDLSSFILGKWTATAWSAYPAGIAKMSNNPQASLLILDFQPDGVVLKLLRQSYPDGTVREMPAEVTNWRIDTTASGTETVSVNNGTPSSPANWVAYAVVDSSTIRNVKSGAVMKRTQ